VYNLGEVTVSEVAVKITLRGHKHPVDQVAFSPDGQYLITVCNKDGSMFTWDCVTGDRLTQNKNTKNINCLKFFTEKDNTTVSLVTTSRGNCKIWLFQSADSGNKIHRVNEEEHWILVGKAIPFNKKFATKEFIDACCWGSYVLLLSSDGLLCMVSRGEQEDKLEKCIDLMIAKTTSMDLYQNTVMCGGDNALVKVIDLELLTLVRKFPKPPPISKENISKDYDDNEMMNAYEEGEEFPQCIGIKTIGSNKLNQFIVTLY
jgi:WD40 repeat protein